MKYPERISLIEIATLKVKVNIVQALLLKTGGKFRKIILGAKLKDIKKHVLAIFCNLV